MYKIDFTDNMNDSIEFTHSYVELINVLNLNINDDILERNVIDEDLNIYKASIIHDRDYKEFIRDLNDAIVNVEVSMSSSADINDDDVYLIVNGAIRGSIKHMSDEDCDMLSMTHIVSYGGDNYADFDSMNVNEMCEMIVRFIDIVKLMNGEGY